MEKIQKEKISKAIEKFNKYKSPEANAELISIGKNSFKIEFSGPFCHSCGFYDYFDDLKIELDDLDVKSKIKGVKEVEDGAEVEFEFVRKGSVLKSSK